MKTSVNFNFSNPEPQIPKVEVGQYYQNYDELYIVANCYVDGYCLISLSDGNRWTEPIENIEEIFSGSKEDFTLVNKVEIIVS